MFKHELVFAQVADSKSRLDGIHDESCQEIFSGVKFAYTLMPIIANLREIGEPVDLLMLRVELYRSLQVTARHTTSWGRMLLMMPARISLGKSSFPASRAVPVSVAILLGWYLSLW